MLKNRTIPYGYAVEMGKITINQLESDVIKQIYLDYASGSSYKKIAEMLTAKKVKYLENKADWNKNMVSRILQNEKYLGTDKYPAIISEEIKRNSVSAQKTYTHTMSDEIKKIKQFLTCTECGGKIVRTKTRTAVRYRCENDKNHISSDVSDEFLLEIVLNAIEKRLNGYKFKEKVSNLTTIEIVELQNKIDFVLGSPEIDVEKLQKDILRLAELKFEMLEDTMHARQSALDDLVEKANFKVAHKVLKSIEISGNKIENIVLIDEMKL